MSELVKTKYTSNQANQGYIINHFSANEKKLYEDKIRLLEDKINYIQHDKRDSK